MYEELVELLRMRAALIDSDLDNQAANAIETLESELNRLKRERDQAVEELHRNTDAVPVVRCKDCVYKASAEVIDGFLICPASGMEICDDDFCSYGKRKEN